MNKFAFNPPTGLLDEAAFPTNPATQQEARGQVQTPMNQLRDFINDKVKPTIDELETFKSELDGSLKEINGYTKLPNGMLLQWGIGTSSIGGKLSVQFPKSFPNNVLNVSITSKENVETDCKTIFSIPDSNTLGFNVSSNVDNIGFFWLAIGY